MTKITRYYHTLEESEKIKDDMHSQKYRPETETFKDILGNQTDGKSGEIIFIEDLNVPQTDVEILKSKLQSGVNLTLEELNKCVRSLI